MLGRPCALEPVCFWLGAPSHVRCTLPCQGPALHVCWKKREQRAALFTRSCACLPPPVVRACVPAGVEHIAEVAWPSTFGLEYASQFGQVGRRGGGQAGQRVQLASGKMARW